jgi:hypothetical protein
VRRQIRDEVIEIAKSENWAQPNAIPDWTRRISISGDMRVRMDNDFYSSVNAPDIVNYAALNANGPIDVNPANGFTDVPFLNTRRNRLYQFQVRARLDVRADPGPWVTADIRLATGTTNSPVSTTQALGGGLSKKNVWLDRAYIDFHPSESLGATFGRMPNPFFSTDLVYDTDLNFDGIAARGVLWADLPFSLFVNAGAFLTDYQDVNFPTHSIDKDSTDSKWLFAAQGGFEWKTRYFTWRTGGAYYNFRRSLGLLSEPCALYLGATQCSTDFSRPAFMQKGNTLFLIRQIVPDPNDPHFKQLQFAGLVFPFHIVNVTSTIDVPVGEEIHFQLTGDYARNVAYKARNACRYGDLAPPVTNVVDPGVLSGVTACSGSTDPNAPRFRSGPNAYMIRASLGHPDPASLGDWNLTAGYKYLQGDAVLDAYTDSDFHLGGTNARGYFLMATVGLAPNTNVQFRWFSSNEVSGPPLSIDVGQVDLNVKF